MAARPDRHLADGSKPKALTSIHDAYTLAATPDACEVNKLMVRHFIETLAEVALSVASRKIVEQEQPR